MEVMCRREDTIQQFQAPVVPVGVRQQLVEFIKGFGTSLKRMLSTKELLLTSVLLGVVWVAVALSYYGTILFGAPVCCAYTWRCFFMVQSFAMTSEIGRGIIA
jgi:hypothetical protein